MNLALFFLLTFNSPVLRPIDKSKSIQTTTLHSLHCKSNTSISPNPSLILVPTAPVNFVLK